ncbi:uncharacterized protein LOC135370377 [Ornithodoros turicata]|uniref:uncharacterized protein LOC135370377 n=1 Tax=Ornithodoros turicata TaxID=34597 RepID=UPI00313A48EF
MYGKEWLRALCSAALFVSVITVKNPCGELPDEPTMLSVIKPVAHAIYNCVENVFLKYQIRSKLAILAVSGMCEFHDKCFKNAPGKVTQEQRSANVDCIVERLLEVLPYDELESEHDPKIVVTHALHCLLDRLDMPMENKRKANAAFHWILAIVRL